MIETQLNASINTAETPGAKPKKILRMVENTRMGGAVPKWEIAKTAADKVQHTLENAQYEQISFENTLAYASGEIRPHEEEFGFGDLVDMVNPLHHIPVVGHVYREVTGDDIHPIGQIIGGAAYGGIAGAASGLANTIIEEETGKDIAGNALSIFNAPLTPTAPNETPRPERLASLTPEAGIEAPTAEVLPGNLLSFVDMKEETGITIKRSSLGSVETVHPSLNKEPVLREREPITEMKLSGLYALSK